MAQQDSVLETTFKSIIQTDKNMSSIQTQTQVDQTFKETRPDEAATLFEKNPLISRTGKHLVNNNDLYRLSTEVTPMYIKNPNYVKQKLNTAIESSAKGNEKDERSFLIEPSPSGVTRIKINNFDQNNANNTVCQMMTDYQPVQSYYSDYKPVTVEFNTNQMHTALFNHQTVFQKPNKIDISTSPIKILNANYDNNNLVSLKDAGSQMELSEAYKRETLKCVGSTDTADLHREEEMPKIGMFVKNKEVRSSLEKSKLVVVNVTPKASKNDELDDLTSPKTKQPFEIDLDTEVQTNEQQLNESVAELPNSYHHHQYYPQHQSNHTPILTSMLKQKLSLNENTKQMAINEEKTYRKMDSNDILNLESNFYYDNIIKLKQTENQIKEEMFHNVAQNNAYEPEQNDSGFNYNNALNKLIDKLNETKTNPMNQRDQCLQFPTPVADNNDKKLPRTLFSINNNECMNTESKTGFFENKQTNFEDKTNSESVQVPLIETFYDGKQVWTATTNILHKLAAIEEENEIKDDVDLINSAVNKKKNFQVKIKLPNETVSEVYEPKPKSNRIAQKCCLFCFVFMILIIALGIVLYFFAWDVLIKRNIINSN